MSTETLSSLQRQLFRQLTMIHQPVLFDGKSNPPRESTQVMLRAR
jgi:hypothetical protein